MNHIKNKKLFSYLLVLAIIKSIQALKAFQVTKKNPKLRAFTIKNISVRGGDISKGSIFDDESDTDYDTDNQEDEDADFIVLNPNYEKIKETSSVIIKELKHQYNSTIKNSLKELTSFIISNKQAVFIGIVTIYFVLHKLHHSHPSQVTLNPIPSPTQEQYQHSVSQQTSLFYSFVQSPTSLIKLLILLDILRKIFFPWMAFSGLSKNNVYVPPVTQTLTFERVHLQQDKNLIAFQRALQQPQAQPQTQHSEEKKRKCGKKTSKMRKTLSLLTFAKTHFQKFQQNFFPDLFLTTQKSNETLVILEFKDMPPNTLSSQLSHLKESIDLLIQLKNTTQQISQVILLITSQGGSVSDYGLASSYLSTLQKHYNTTVFVDTIAASGGYMLACQAQTIYATPTALVGSIGVIATSFNFFHVLEKFGIYNKVTRGGLNKTPVLPVGQVNTEQEETIQRFVTRVHLFFQQLVKKQRKSVNEEVMQADVFLGQEALELGLIDGILSSQEYISQKINEGCQVLKIVKFDGSKLFFGRSFDSNTMGMNYVDGVWSFLRSRIVKFLN